MPAISAMRARIASRCGPTRGASQTRLTSRWAIRPPRARHARGGVLEEDRRRRAAPFRLRGREMGADVAVAERAVDRVAQRVQHHVGVGMAFELVAVRDFHAAEPHRVALGEGVDVETLADAHVVKLGASRSAAASRSLIVVTLKLSASPSNTCTAWPAASATAASSVMSARAAARCAARMRSKRNACGVCAARRDGAVGRGDDAVAVDLLDRVGDGGRRDRRAEALGRGDGAGDQRRRDERPRAVVDQHDVGRFAPPAPRGRCARWPAGCRRRAPAAASARRRRARAPAPLRTARGRRGG